MSEQTTTSTIISEWSDPPEEGRDEYEWPYPTRYQRSLIEGGLADAIRSRLGQPGTKAVYITEQVISGGYSEYTQEDDYSHTISVGDVTVEMGSNFYGDNCIDVLIKWLDAKDSA